MGRSRRALTALAGMLAALTAITGCAADLVLEVLALKYRPVEQVLPVLQPLVPQPGTVSGMNGQLIVRATPANLAEIKRILAILDRPPRRLMITVRQDVDRDEAATGAGVSGTIRTEPRQASEDSNRVSGSVTARAYSTQTARNERYTQQIQVTEGNAATINVGYSIPVYTGGVVRDRPGGRAVERWVDTVEYRDILTGFSVRPQLAGDTVTLQVSPQHDTPGRYGRGSSDVQRLETTVSGRLGEWIDIGGVVRGSAFESGTGAYRTRAASGDNRRVLLRVEALD